MKNTLNVIFRADKDNNEIIAFFPDEPGTRNPGTCTVYTHKEQHAHATIDYYRANTRPASPAQYAALHQELQRIENTFGDKLTITPRKRFHQAYNARRAQLA